MTVQAPENSSRRPRRSSTMGGMPLNDMPWWRWRSNVRSALHMLSDPVFQQNVWLAGVDAYVDHQAWPEAVRAARDAHVRMASSDGEDPDAPPRTLEVLQIMTRSA